MQSTKILQGASPFILNISRISYVMIVGGKCQMILFFYGEDTYRMRQKLKALKEKFVSASLGDTNLAVLDGAAVTYDEFIRQILAMPFLSKSRLVIVENLLKNGKKDILEKVPEALPKVPKSTVLVFVEEGNPDKRTSIYKKLNRPGQTQEFKLL